MKIIFRVLCRFGILSAATVLAQDGNLVMNGGFCPPAEQQTIPWPEPWSPDRSGKNLYRCTNVDGYASNDSLEYYAGESVAAEPIIQEVTCTAHTEYTVTGALKSDGITRPLIQIDAPDLGLHLVRLTAEKAPRWQFLRATFQPGAATKLRISLFGDRENAETGQAVPGRSWFDSIAICPVTETPHDTERPELVMPPGENIALHRAYTLKPVPNYSYCTDPDDKNQLTDGICTTGYFWTQKTTVGWTRAMPVDITIDLGELQPIGGVSYNTAAGTAGVTWPETVFILVSDDGKTWSYEGDLMRLGTAKEIPVADKYAVYRFTAAELQTRGRFVKLLVAQTPYCFVDEIEVYRGKAEYLTQRQNSVQITDAMRFFTGVKVSSSLTSHLKTDLANLEKAWEAAGLAPEPGTEWHARFRDIRKRIEEISGPVPDDFRTILPLNPLHADILALNTPLLQARGYSGLVPWKGNRWDTLSITEAPETPPKEIPALRVTMMRGEVRGETLNLTNATNAPMQVLVSYEGLPGENPPPYLRICDVLFTDTRTGTPIAAALPEAERTPDGTTYVNIPAGCTKQIWLSFHRPVGIAGGTYPGVLKLCSQSTGNAFEVPITLELADLDFPKDPVLSVGGWDYLNGNAAYYRAPGNARSTIALLKDNYINTAWATGAVQPRGAVFDDLGHLTNGEALDFSEWDKWVDRWQGARTYFVFLSVGPSFQGEPMGTQKFTTMVGDWFGAWLGHLREQGLQPRQLGILLVDEPHAEAQDTRIITWAQAIKSSRPDVVLFEDPTWRDPEKAAPELFEVVDILCPNTPMMLAQGGHFREFYEARRKNGRELWLYSCSGPAKLLDPITYHRGQNWWAIRMEATGSHYWAMGCAGGSGNSWNAYAQNGVEYSPYFVAPDTVTEGKHMEAIREGVQDYEYFVMLRNRISACRQRGLSSPLLTEAEAFLEDGPRQVTETISKENLSWSTDKDRSIMDAVRIRALQFLIALK